MEDEGATLGVGFAIDFYDSFGQLKTLDDLIGVTQANAVREFQKIQQAVSGSVNTTTPRNEIAKLGEVTTRTAAQAERSAESMVKQLNRQIEVYGKTASEVRALRAEQRALAAEQAGLGELAGRLRAVSAEMGRLEATAPAAARNVGATRAAMQGLSFQAQDAFTQISMGTNVLSVLAIQGGQAAGQMAGMQGAMGKVANFLIGPWGLAFTGALLVAGALTKGLFDGASAAEAKAKAAKDLTDAIDQLSKANRALTATEWDQQKASLASALALRQKALDARAATMEEIAHARALLATAIAESARPDPSRGQDGGVDFAMARAAQLETRLKGLDADLTEQQVNLRKTEVAFRDAQASYLGAAIGARLDKEAGLTRQYQKDLSALNQEFRQTGDVQAYARARSALEQTYSREKAALEEAGKKHRGLTEEQRRAKEEAKLLKKAQDELAKTLDTIITKFAPARNAAQEYAKTLADIDRLAGARMIGSGEAVGYKISASQEAAAAEAASLQERINKTLGYTMGGDNDPLMKLIGGWNRYAEEVREAAVTAQLNLNGTEGAAARAADEFERMADAMARAGDGFARAFGPVGGALNEMTNAIVTYGKKREAIADLLKKKEIDQAKAARQSLGLQLDLYGDVAGAAKTFFKENSAGYKAMEVAEKAYRAVQFAMSVQAMAQNMAETLGIVSNAATRATAEGTAGIAAQSKLPFPFNIVAMGATAAALVAAGVAIVGAIGGGGGNRLPQSNTGTGTVLGDSSAQSDSIRNAIDALKEVDTLTSNYARQMAASLRSIENQIGGLASLVVRSGDINANGEANLGFTPNIIGKVLGSIPLIGGLLGGLFGSRTDVVGSGVYGAAQTIGSIRDQGFDASYYSDLQKTKKFLGVVTGRSYSTQYSAADPTLENQFTLLLRQFNDAIVAAAGPLGAATADIQNRLNGFVVNLGKIDLKDLTGEEIQEKLTAVFGKAADEMANAAFPGMQQFQRVGEGLFETLVRVASTVDAVSGSLDLLGTSAQGMSVAAKVGLAEQFDSISDLTSAADAYFQAFYSQEEQAAARTAQMGKVFASLGLTMPPTLAAFRQLVEAQNLTTAAGQATYATLLQLAPAFAELQEAMAGAKSAADIASERQDLERQLLELQGNTAALRSLQLARLDASNRALQEQIWAIQDAQEAARAAEELAKAWGSVGDTIKAEIDRIRGLDSAGTGSNFATLMGQFNAANEAARAGDMDAAKSLPGLSQALLNIAAQVATSRQELDRVRAQTAASLETTNAAIATLAGTSPAQTDAALLAAVTTASAATAANADENAESLRTALAEVRAEIAAMRADNNAGHAATAGNTASMKRTLDSVTSASGGDAISTVQAA